MTYEFICDETGEIVEKDFPMKDVPRTLKIGEKNFRRNWSFSKSIHIPFQWGDTRNRPKFDKSPSGKKHYW